MPRSLRVRGNEIHYHIILRCNNGGYLFRESKDFQSFLAILGAAKDQYQFKLYNYVMLNTHIHLLISTHHDQFIDKVMHNICFKYAKEYNMRHGRTGHFWAHRYRSHIIADDKYGLACLRYQHRNPLSAGLVIHPEFWPWSSYSFYVFGKTEKDNFLEAHPSFLALSENMTERRRMYKEIVCQTIPADDYKFLVEKARKITSERFCSMVEQVHGLRQSVS